MNKGVIRRAVLEVLAETDDSGLTPRELKEGVCEHLNTNLCEVFGSDSNAKLGVILDFLMNTHTKWVEISDRDTRRLRITNEGRKFLENTSK